MTQAAFGFGLPKSKWKPPEELPPLPDGLDIGMDTETYDPYLDSLGPGWAWQNTGKMVGVSIASLELGAFYFPVAHQGGDNLDEDIVQEYLQDAVNSARRICFHNAAYDVGWLRRFGVHVPSEKIHDSMLMEPLLNEHARSYSLNATAKRRGLKVKAEGMLQKAARAMGLNPKEDLWKLPARYVGEYAEQDAWLALQLFYKQGVEITKQELTEIYNLERSLVVPLIDIRERGVRVDRDKAERTYRDLHRKVKRILAEIRRITGVRVDPWNAISVAQALHQQGISVPRTPKSGQPSVTKALLEDMESDVAKLVLEARRWHKAADTFVKGHVLGSSKIDGRVHAQLNQLMSDDGGTVSGRFSCSKPNLQQIPARDEEVMKIVRSLYLPEEGEQWAVLDYSQQEPRLTVHWADRAGIRGAADAVRKYHEDPTMSFHTMVADMTGLDYKPAKILNLGMFYGMGGAKFCRSIGLPVESWEDPDTGQVFESAGEEGQAMIDQYHRNVPFIRGLSELTQSVARRRRYIKTILGRRCRFVEDYDIRKAMNRLIQGSAADQTKKAMRLMADADLSILTTVHDEVDISFSDPKDLEVGKEAMEQAVELRVPVKVDIETGPTWGEVA